MRKLFLFAALLMAVSLYSQNWAPINSTEKFCYSTDDDLEIINNVLWVDSVEMMGNDSLFHLNKIARSFEGQDFQYLYNEPQFLLDDVIVKENGEWLFIDTSFTNLDEIDTFKIIPHANYYDSWQFSSELDAVIANVSTQYIFGILDSVKTILLSDYSQILISKNYGIINWRNQFELIGIEGRDLGIQVPNFEDMYAFLSSGDVICIRADSWEAGAGVVQLFVKIRYDIHTVDKYQDSIVVDATIRTDKRYVYWEKDLEKEINIDRQLIVLKRNREMDAYPNELISQHIHDYYAWGSALTIYKLDYYKWGGVKKTQVLHDGTYYYGNCFYECPGNYSFELCESFDELVLKEYSEKFGFLEYSNDSFEHGGDREIVGIINDGDTLGVVYPMELFVRANQLSINSNWILYPNPAKEFITIQLSEKQYKANYKIYNLNGTLIKEGKLNQSESSISIKELPKGMYFIELNINGELSTQKWIKN